MKQYCYWLLPSPEDSSYLQYIVDDLAKKHNATSFTPHLTLYPFSGIEKNDAITLLQNAVENISPFSISAEVVNATEAFFKTVFIEFPFNEQLRLINSRLNIKLQETNPYEFKPHISLLYKDYPIEKKHEIAKETQVKNEYLMDSVVMIEILGKDTDLNWPIIYSQKLQ